MPSVTCFNYRFTPSWIMVFLTLIFISLFTRLGFWQIHRAAQKEHMLSAEAHLAQQKPSAWHTSDQLPAQYQRIAVTGHYLPYVFLLDNQHQQHQFGYDVLSPLVLDNGSVVLIDRGWVKGDNTRLSLPQINTPTAVIHLLGSAYFPSKNPLILGLNIENRNAETAIIENIDVKTASQVLQKKVHPFIIRLNKEDKYGFVRNWAIVSMPPERHLAYALQWFVMALAVLIIFIALNLKKNEKTKF